MATTPQMFDQPHIHDIGPGTTISGRPLKTVYRPIDTAETIHDESIGEPGQYPFTRGVHPEMHRKRLWTMRQFAGFGAAKDTNERFKFLLSRGQTGLSTAFDLPTLMGRDADDPLSIGEVGKCGVSVSSLKDMEVLFDGIDLGKVSVSKTINAPAAIVMAYYIAAADKQGVKRDQLRGTCQNDILKEFHAQNEYVFPPEQSVRLVIDTIEFCQKELPQYNPVSVSGYHIREAGSTAGQELAFTIRDGVEYVEWCIKRGMNVDDFAPRLSYFFNSHNDFLEEIAKFRAARRLWARLMKDRFGAKSERSMWLRFHAQTAGCSLYGKQVHNNIIRTAYQAMAAVLGGCQSLHTNSMDETLALPTEHAVTVALRTQQVLAFETGVTNTVDPFGGSYAIESLTNQLEAEAMDYIRRIDEMGGMIPAIENGFVRREIAEAAFKYSQAVESKSKTVVGVNDYMEDDGPPVELLKIDASVEREGAEAVRRLRQTRDNAAVQRTLAKVTADAKADRNVMPALIDAAKAYATLGETVGALAAAFGRFDGGPLW